MEVVLSREKITEQQVDVIVNCILSDIQLSDRDVSSRRTDIRVERQRNMEIYSTPLHTWSHEGEELLKTLVMSCFEKAEGARHTSIAFTTETMAILQYPPDVVAKVFFETIVKFAEKNPDHLQKVVLVALPSAKSFIKAFDEERLKHVFESNIQLNSALDETPLHFPRKRTYRRIRRSGVSYVVGDLVKQNVDVIVNSIGNGLNLSRGPISKIILEAAGPSIQEECQTKYPHGIESWGVAVTSGGNINCKQIYHISLVRSEWSSVKQKYKDIINCLLEKADSTGHTSIAFPVLGTGLIQYPSDQVAKSLFETAMAFYGNHLKTILFVVHPKDFANRKAFEKEELNHIQLEEHVLVEVIRRGAACSIGLVKGDIANQNVDVIINSTSPKLDSTGGSVTRAGGHTLLQECKTKYPNGIKSGEIAVTGGGDLNCKNVYHITLDKWSPDEKTVNAFREQIDNCFLKAASDGVTSVAFPVLGTGVEKYPADVVSKVIFESFDDFNNNNRNTSLQDVRVVIEPGDTENWRVFTDVERLQVPRRQRECSYPLRHGADFATTGLFDHHDMFDELLTTPSENQTEKTRQSWNDMSKDEFFKLIQLPPQTEESKSVEQNFKATLSSDVDIIKIERVQNKTLFDQYCIMKRRFDEKNPTLQNERKLWHGTSSDSTNSINTYGFNRSYCGKNATAYGNGAYFATNASYSADDTYSPPDSEGYKYIYQALVLTGDYTVGSSGIRVPPQKPGSASHVRFDSVVDRKQNPNMFVIFNDTQAYPEYLITFRQDPRQHTVPSMNVRRHTVPSINVMQNADPMQQAISALIGRSTQRPNDDCHLM